jgi:hypothetical protein
MLCATPQTPLPQILLLPTQMLIMQVTLTTEKVAVAVFFYFGPVVWLSRKQPCTATSTTESEYVAASLTSKEVVWARRLLADIGFPQQVPTPLFSDNQSAIMLVQNPEFHKRTKHIDVVYHLIREFQERGDISILYVPTKLQLADILTKALTPDTFHKLRDALNLSKKVLHQVGDSTLG